MNLSEDTLAVVEYLDQYCKGNLRKKNDIGVVLELAATADDAEIVHNIVFAGTSLWKVFTLLRKQTPQSEGFKQLEDEFASAMNALRSQLAALIEQAPDEVVLRFHDTYLGMGSGIIRNLTDLAHDMANFKELQNDMKRGK